MIQSSQLVSPTATAPPDRRLVVTNVEGPIAVLRICRRLAKQTINPATLFQLHEAIDWAAECEQVRGIVITGQGGKFVSGADTRYFLNGIERREFGRLVEFTRAGLACFEAIERCPKPVVAAMNGSAIGGGLELALACHARVASMAATLALPETSIGLVPGWGGGYRARALLGAGLAKWLVYCGPFVPAREAEAIGLVHKVTTPRELLDAAKQLALNPAEANQPRAPKRETAEFFEAHSIDDLLAGQARGARPAGLERIEETLATKSPMALRLAQRQFELAKSLSPDEYWKWNLEAVDQVFRSHDALTGLSAIERGEEPPYQFEGR